MRITREQALRFRHLLEKAAESQTDEDALQSIELFKHWKADEQVSVGDRLQYNGILYKCVQSHTTQSDWTPDITPALWSVVSVEEWPEWVQPVGAQDAYMQGDKVSHNGKHWISAVDNNVWEPSVFGWNEQLT